MGRSKQLPVSLSIRLPTLDVERQTNDRKIEFRKTLETLRTHAQRIRYLYIQANNSTFMLFFNRFLNNVNFSALETLILEQVIADSRTYAVGPVVFNPAVFHTLRLENIMIECNAPCLAGLRVLHAIHTSGTILDHRQLTHATYPVIPEGPTMNNLRELIIDKTHIIQTHSQLTPSFSNASLRKLTLARIRVPTPEARTLILRLFHMTYSPLLENLVLETIEIDAFHIFVGFLTTSDPVPKFACVRRLALVNLQFDYTPQMVEVLRMFLRAFPRVDELHLVAVSPAPVWLALVDTTLMPLLTSINTDHKRHPRMAPPPSLPLAVAPAPQT
ncbi:hypothetical protein DXG03_004773 [Asterophora parasitica]|uniref:Uncharacterized protein n=1 Tax=Asterophora parasitica TaxID=117018 RepID=A0A9P7G688_9AGAR|nr:hypothetical protein DXG03_004773 [Asterophora parasitica]